jgi:oxygen-dependent protoporphyrinogen oxidase
VAVVGGGITGLAAAHRVLELLPHTELLLLEASARLGGVLDTIHRDGFLVERSADNFLTKMPWAVELCSRLGLADQLLPTDESRRRAYVVRDGELLPVPDGFVLMKPGKLRPLVSSPILSWRGKLRLLAEPWVRRRMTFGAAAAGISDDESVAAFAARRLGREAFERLVQPLVAGIYTADPDKLSMAATLPELLAMERDHGSLYRASRHGASDATAQQTEGESGARYSLFVAPQHGMGSIVAALADRLPDGAVRRGIPVSAVRRDAASWILDTGGAAPSGVRQQFDAVIIALPAYAAANLFSQSVPPLADLLAQIEYAGCAVVSLAYQSRQFGRPLSGFGFVVPRAERRRIIAASFASEKFSGRTPDDCTLVRVFIGGALQPELLDQNEERLVALAHAELSDLLKLRGQPLWFDLARWPRSMPQYHVGHLDRVARIEAAVNELPGIELAGNAYRGVGIPQCVHSGESAAERIVEQLRDFNQRNPS